MAFPAVSPPPRRHRTGRVVCAVSVVHKWYCCMLLQEGVACLQQGRGDFGWAGGPRQAPCPRAADGERAQTVSGLPQRHWSLSAWPHWPEGLMHTALMHTAWMVHAWPAANAQAVLTRHMVLGNRSTVEEWHLLFRICVTASYPAVNSSAASWLCTYVKLLRGSPFGHDDLCSAGLEQELPSY